MFIELLTQGIWVWGYISAPLRQVVRCGFPVIYKMCCELNKRKRYSTYCKASSKMDTYMRPYPLSCWLESCYPTVWTNTLSRYLAHIPESLQSIPFRHILWVLAYQNGRGCDTFHVGGCYADMITLCPTNILAPQSTSFPLPLSLSRKNQE